MPSPKSEKQTEGEYTAINNARKLIRYKIHKLRAGRNGKLDRRRQKCATKLHNEQQGTFKMHLKIIIIFYSTSSVCVFFVFIVLPTVI